MGVTLILVFDYALGYMTRQLPAGAIPDNEGSEQ